MQLNEENYAKGFLIDEEWMAGVSRDPEKPGSFLAYVLSHQTGEYVGCHPYQSLGAALRAVNEIPRRWKFESSSGCGGGQCGAGSCGTGACGTAECPGVCDS